MGVKGVFREHTTGGISYGEGPQIGDVVWIDNTTGIIYNYDNDRNAWLSASRHMFEFARKGSARGMYIPLLGDLDNTGDVYMSGTKAVIISVFCRSRFGNKNMGFEVRKNDTMIYEFYYSGSNLLYVNNNLNLEIDPYDQIQVYVKNIWPGPGVVNTVCRLETAWRYDV